MKKSGLILSLVCVAATGALAADLPSRRAPPVFVPPPLVFSWTGFYAGLNAGYAFDGNTSYQLSGTDATTVGGVAGLDRAPFYRTRSNGFTGGGQIGYNFELGNGVLPGASAVGGGGIVVGVEADAAYTDLDRTGSYLGPNGDFSLYGSKLDFLGTVRGRIGYAFSNFMIYGTGGFAYGGVRDNATFYNTVGAINRSGLTDTIRTGYAYGGGVEYAIPTASFLNPFNASAVTLKAEFIRYDLGTNEMTIANPLPNAYNARVRTEGNLVRAGINYKFGAAPAPIVARY